MSTPVSNLRAKGYTLTVFFCRGVQKGYGYRAKPRIIADSSGGVYMALIAHFRFRWVVLWLAMMRIRKSFGPWVVGGLRLIKLLCRSDVEYRMCPIDALHPTVPVETDI